MKGDSNNKLYWGKTNSIIFAVGILTIILGYIFLARESLTLAPILLVLGYAVLIPISLVYKDWIKKKKNSKE